MKVFYRRLFILLIIDAGHLLLLWEGDILFLYAFVGMLLPLFRKCSDKTLLTLVVMLIASPLLFDIISVLFHYKNGNFTEKIAKLIDKKKGIPVNDSFGQYLYSKGDAWQHWRNWQASGFFTVIHMSSILTAYQKCLACFYLVFMQAAK